MLQAKPDLRYLVRQIALQTRHLILIWHNPGPAAHPDAEAAAGNIHDAHGIAAIAAFFESHLPGRLPSPLTQTLARHLEVLDVMRMKNQDEAGCPHRGNIIRKLV